MEKHSNGYARLHPTSGAAGNGTFSNNKSRPSVCLVQFSKAHWQPVLDLLEFLPSLYPNGDKWLENRLAEVLGRQATCIVTAEEFISLCRKRSVFSDAELKKHWNWNPRNRPFVVNFLYVYSLPKRPNLAKLKDEKIITEAPRGFDEISDTAFSKLIEISNADKRIIID